MNKYTIIPEDKLVIVDGVGCYIEALDVPPGIHAVQWQGTWGEMEYEEVMTEYGMVKPQNEKFYDPERFRAALDAWGAAKPLPPPPPTLDDLKAAKWKEIKQQRILATEFGIEYMGKTFDSDFGSLQRIAIASTAAQTAMSNNEPYSIKWTCADNTIVTLDAQQMLGLSTAIMGHLDTMQQRSTTIRAKIDAATTVEDLDSISW